MNFFDRLSNGWTIAMNSFKVLKENKQLIIFPILSGIAILLAMGSFFLVLMNRAGWDPENLSFEGTPLYYVVVFVFYLFNYFVVVFFNMALIHCTRMYFRGEEVSVRAGIAFSLSRIRVIFAWAFFAATVGLLLKTIQDNVGWLGKILITIVGVAWSIATFFVVPVIAYENAGPLTAFKRSSQLMKQKWGESLGATFNFGLITLVAFVIIGLPLFLIGNAFNPIVGIILVVLALFLVSSIISAAQTIFVSAVYHNINGDPVKHFNQQMVDQLFQKNEKKNWLGD